jgi:uncharacterized protein DUF1579
MEMPKLTDAHRQIERFAGNWSGTETLHPSPWMPQGGKATGRLNHRRALDGFAVIGDYEQERGGKITFSGHSVYLWNPAEKCVELHWYDSMGQPPEVFRGTFSGNTIELKSKNAQGWARMTYDFSSPARLGSKMEMSEDGKTWKTFFDAVYEKLS